MTEEISWNPDTGSEPQPLLSIIIVSYNTRDILRDCVQSIYRETTLLFEIIIVDNVSHDGTPAMIRTEFPDIILLANTENYGFTKGNNQGLARARGAYTLFLNPDTIILDHAIDRMMKTLMQNDDIVCVGPHTYNADGVTTQGTVLNIPTISGVMHTHIPVVKILLDGLRQWIPTLPRVRTVHEFYCETSCIVEVVKGSCMLMRTAEVRAVGGMNESLFMFSEEVELCEKLALHFGKHIYYDRSAHIIHLGGQSMQQVSEHATERYVESASRYFAMRYPSSVAQAVFRWTTWFGSIWRYCAWFVVRWLRPAQRTIAQIRLAEHAVMIRWLWRHSML